MTVVRTICLSSARFKRRDTVTCEMPRRFAMSVCVSLCSWYNVATFVINRVSGSAAMALWTHRNTTSPPLNSAPDVCICFSLAKIHATADRRTIHIDNRSFPLPHHASPQ
jgi:hypothetical protein